MVGTAKSAVFFAFSAKSRLTPLSQWQCKGMKTLNAQQERQKPRYEACSGVETGQDIPQGDSGSYALLGGRESDMRTANRQRLRGLMTVLGVSVADVARLLGISRPLMSRILSGDPAVNADTVIFRLESRLPDLVAARRKPFFDLAGAALGAVQAAMGSR